MCDLGDYLERFDFAHISRHKARKQYKCDCCGGVIKKGTQYLKHFSKGDGKLYSEKMCEACDIDTSEFSKQHSYIQTTPSYYGDLIKECLDEREDFRDMLKWARILRNFKNRKEAAL